DRPGHRHRRLGAQPGGAVRRRGLQADAAARAARRMLSALGLARLDRPARAVDRVLRERIPGARRRARAGARAGGARRPAARRAEERRPRRPRSGSGARVRRRARAGVVAGRAPGRHAAAGAGRDRGREPPRRHPRARGLRAAPQAPRRARRRLEAAKDVPAADYVELLQLRSRLVSGFRRERLGVDALLVPTVPKIAPAIEPLEGDMERFFAVNPLMLRNTSPFNFLDTCAASLPIQRRGEAPVGLTVAGFPGEDERVLAIALAVEAALGTPA